MDAYKNNYKAYQDSLFALINNYGNNAEAYQDSMMTLVNNFKIENAANADSLKAAAADANEYLKEMRDSIAPMIAAIRNIKNDGNSDMTFNQFKTYMQQRDSVNSSNYFINLQQMFDGLGLDSLIAYTKDADEVINIINGKMDSLQTAFDQLLNLDLGNPDAAVLAKLQEMLEFLQTHNFCNCNCSGSGNNSNHEGVLDNLDNTFAQNVSNSINNATAKFYQQNKDKT